jgi:hypothetical protein
MVAAKITITSRCLPGASLSTAIIKWLMVAIYRCKVNVQHPDCGFKVVEAMLLPTAAILTLPRDPGGYFYGDVVVGREGALRIYLRPFFS